MKVLLAQIGARKNYAALRAFASQGCLHRFYTDLYYDRPLTKAMCKLCGAVSRGGLGEVLRGRRCDGVPASQARDFPWFAIKNRRRVRDAARAGRKYVAFRQGGHRFAELVAARGFAGVDVVYAYSSAALELFRAAREHGVLCVLDHETPPAEQEFERVLRGTLAHRDWSPHAPETVPEGLREYAARQREEAQLADLVIAPSGYGRDLVVESGVDAEKVGVVPFSMDPRFVVASRPNASRHREGLRVLFVGNDPIRKGLPDLVAALRKLGSSSRVTARGIGAWSLSRNGEAQCEGAIEAIGSVPRSRMAEHYAWADVFVLPTLSDAMGVVILEAMASGLPVITTPSSGGPEFIEHGKSGFLVEVADVAGIARCLSELSERPDRLQEIALAARNNATRFDAPAYASKLIDRIRSALPLANMSAAS